MPLYSQVTFSNIRYSDALKNGQAQEEIMKQVMKIDNIHENWDDQKVMDKMLELIS
jgi:kynurenine 3-monooxygenase